MEKIKGNKVGQVKVFKNKDKAQAFNWNGNSWELIGDVESSNNTKQYHGDKYFPAGSYDFVFNIEDESGGRRLLPFNKSDNVLTTTEKFLAKE